MEELLKQWAYFDRQFDRKYCVGSNGSYHVQIECGFWTEIFCDGAFTLLSDAYIRQAVLASVVDHGFHLESHFYKKGVEIRGYASEEAYDSMKADVYADCDSEVESLLTVIVELHRISNGQQERDQLFDAHSTDSH